MRWAILCFLAFSYICHAQEDPGLTCNKGLATDAKFATLTRKTSLVSASDLTFEMLADQTFANKKERKAIAIWMQAKDECIKSAQDFRQSNYPPQIRALITEADGSLKALAVDLYNDKITFGEFNRRYQVLANDITNRATVIIQQLKSQQAAQRMAEEQKADEQRMAEQQRADQQAAQAAALRQQLLLQMIQNNKPIQVPLPPPIPPPVNTNCTVFGNSVNCITR